MIINDEDLSFFDAAYIKRFFQTRLLWMSGPYISKVFQIQFTNVTKKEQSGGTIFLSRGLS